MTFDEYQKRAFATARIDWSNRAARAIPLLGIVGELGSVASEMKKAVRDGKAYTDGPKHLCEEFGDLLWYVVPDRERTEACEPPVACGRSRTGFVVRRFDDR